jgi:bifunctional enzyme CysN/CysC
MTNTKVSQSSLLKKFLATSGDLPLLKFITCGSVDDGKSTLIGRIFYESNRLYDDQLKNLISDSKKHGTQGKKIDFALLVDGLSAEREQGITIDVAYRFFSTNKKKFIIADCPGHTQYTRNMVTGASNSDAAIILIDSRKGILDQTRRHSFICSLLGIKKIILAVNKMDLVNYDQKVFEEIKENYLEFSQNLDFEKIVIIPISALEGDNIIKKGNNLDWYKGKPLLNTLENFDADNKSNGRFHFAVQQVFRPNQDFRGYAGTISEGNLKVGDKIRIHPSGSKSKVKTISVGMKSVKSAIENQSIVLSLEDEIDISRGDLLTKIDEQVLVSDHLEIDVAWLSDIEAIKGRSFTTKVGFKTIKCLVTEIKYKYDLINHQKIASKSLSLNDLARISIRLNQKIPFQKYSENKKNGSLILIDEQTNQTVAAGMIIHGLRRAQNIFKQETKITRDAREKKLGSKSKVLWLTGLSGSGKSTIASELELRLSEMNLPAFVLDGDNLRFGLNQDLGFTEQDRVENIRRAGEVAKLFLESGMIVICSFISPFSKDRKMVRDLFEEGDFIEIFVDTPIKEAEKRDPKGLYKKARMGDIPNFTGITSPYEKPVNPEISLKTLNTPVEKSVEKILSFLNLI